MLTIKTALTNGEHKVSLYSVSLANASGKLTPVFVLKMVNESGEMVTISTRIMNSFDIHSIQEIMNSLIDGLNYSFPVKTLKFIEGDEFPRLNFVSFQQFENSLQTIGYLLKDFGAVIRINLTGKKSEPLQIMAVEAA